VSLISRILRTWLAAAILFSLVSQQTQAATITLNDGRILRGRLNEVAGVAEDPLKPRIPAGGVQVKPIVVIDDGLRRTYVPQRHILNSDPKEPRQATIRIDQTVATFGRPVAVVGAPLQITPFDSYGRRIYSMKTVDETLHVVQGITEITPVYTRVEGLMGPDQPVIWDQRIATTSVPRDVLTQVLERSIPQDDAPHPRGHCMFR